MTATVLLALSAIALTGGTSLAAGVQVAAPAVPLPYANPFTSSAWLPSRIDMGVDWTALSRTPVVAIGDGVVLGSQSDAGWPGHRLMWYRLLDGTHAGDVIYVAEHLRDMLPAGTVVQAGETIAMALPGWPGTEWGWAGRAGVPRAAPCYHEGMKTNSGREMERFLMTLGASTYEQPGSGSDQPVGRRC